MKDRSRPRGRRRYAGVKKHYWGLPMNIEKVPDPTARRESFILWKSTLRKAIERNTAIAWPTREVYHDVGREALIELIKEYEEPRTNPIWLRKATDLRRHLDRLHKYEDAGGDVQQTMDGES